MNPDNPSDSTSPPPCRGKELFASNELSGINEPTLEQSIRDHLPPVRRVLLHLAALVAAAYLIGPWVGPRLFDFVDPQTTWGRGQVHQIDDVMNWGTLFLIAELLVYTAWIMKQGRKGYDAYHARQWRKALEGEIDD